MRLRYSLLGLVAVLLTGLATPAAAQIALPVTFEDGDAAFYELTDFEGGDAGPTSTVVVDPTDASNMVVQTVRPSTAVCYAGTTVANTTGFTESIPFTATETTMSVRVWSPEAGVLVLFKVEDKDDAGRFVETYSYTTVANAWETMVFDFADPKPNDSAIVIGAPYNKASIFFDYQCDSVPATALTPANRTYYWDDIAFGNGSMAGGSALVITGIIDGPLSGGVPKAIELYATQDIADLSVYGLERISNGGGSSGTASYTFPATSAAAGDYLYASSDADGFMSFFGFASDFSDAPIFVNGDDAVALYLNGALVDVIGDPDVDGTDQVWEYTDGWAYRMGGAGPSATFDAGEFTYSGIDALDGATTNATATTPFPVGTYAGGTPPVEAVTLTALLRGENEVPAVETDAKGGTTVVVDGTTVTVTGSFAGLTGNYAASHIHGGAAGENGGVVQALSPTVNADMRGGTFEAAMNTFTVRASFADSLRAGLAYVNIHSAAFPTGEIRGQINGDTHMLPFALSGDNEVPPNASPATGSGTVTLDGAMVTLTGSFAGLTGNYRFSHIHGGAAGENGGVVVTLMATVDTDMRGGTFAADMNMFTVRPSFADSIRAGLAYVNVHSDAFPGGEIRGQIGTEAPLMTVTLADARAQGVGATVQIEGTVTRALGAFAYVQDGTAAIALRQTSGAFFDAVAAGTIVPGTTVRLVGTLSEFNGLLQINGGDLESYEVTGTADVPEAQVVTLAMLASNGEDYESELVTVETVTIDADGDTLFSEGGSRADDGETYQIVDASDATNAVSLRVPNDGDTTADGTAIPPRATITGIASQFDGSDPRDEGYQILLIDVADLEALPAVANEGDENSELTLAVANPVRSGATVRFTLDVAGEARVVLYDALGRQVAVLANGVMTTGTQTARLDAGALATGVYVLRLEAESGVVSRTLTVVR